MKTNTFYNPKNQYNELLASEPYVKAEDAILDAKIDTEIENREAADKSIHNKIDTLNTIKVKWINAGRGDNKCSNIEDYFVSLIEPASSFHVDSEKLKVELGQTIYIVEGKDDSTTYEEWICLYPDFSEHHVDYNGCKIPVMVRLGAVDSILARENSPGSVQLVHNLYEVEDWSKYFATDFEGNVTHRPIKGEAVAPCALKAFVEADKEIIGSLELEIAARKEAVETEEAARIDEDNTIKARLDKIEAEIEGSSVEEEIGFQDSRLDRIEAVIGMNHHHCDNCGCEHSHCTCNDDKCSCSDAKDKCTIYCRLNDAEDDLQTHMDTLEEHRERLESLESITTAHEEEIGNLKEEDEAIRTLIDTEVTRLDEKIDGNVERLDGRINEANVNIAANKEHIERVETDLNVEKKRSLDEDNAIWAEIGESTLPAEGTIWSEIKGIQNAIGTQDAPLDDTIWQRIYNNNEAFKAEVSRSTKEDEKLDNRATALESNVKEINDEIGAKQPTDVTIWGSIHAEIDNRKDADTATLTSAKTYADGLKVITLSEAAADAKEKADTAETNAIAASKEYTDDIADALRDEISAAKAECKNHTDTTAANTLQSAKDDATVKANAAITTAANDATTKAEAAKDAAIAAAANDAANKVAIAIETAGTNATAYTDNEITKLETVVKEYSDTNLGLLSADLSKEISDSKAAAIEAAGNDATNKANEAMAEAVQTSTIKIGELRDELNAVISAKVSSSEFEAKVSTIESEIESKASVNELSETNNKLNNVEKSLENTIHEFHHLTSQTQFVVRTTLPGTGSKTIQLHNLIGSASNEWDFVGISAVIANNATIYPEIVYEGEIGEGKNDNRQVVITFEHGNSESLPVTLIVSAFKAAENRIIEID